jgi:hypothetical protein
MSVAEPVRPPLGTLSLFVRTWASVCCFAIHLPLLLCTFLFQVFLPTCPCTWPFPTTPSSPFSGSAVATKILYGRRARWRCFVRSVLSPAVCCFATNIQLGLRQVGQRASEPSVHRRNSCPARGSHQDWLLHVGKLWRDEGCRWTLRTHWAPQVRSSMKPPGLRSPFR